MTRVIAGTHKGRRILVPEVGVRPTTDRVREAIFSSVASRFDFVGKRVLDLYSGTGALAIEALSRGCSYAVLVEADRKIAGTTKQNVTKLDLFERCDIVTTDALQLISQSRLENANPSIQQGPFELIFIDPPYEESSESVSELLLAMIDNLWVADASLVVVERATKSAPIEWPASFASVESRPYGDTTVWYGQRDV